MVQDTILLFFCDDELGYTAHTNVFEHNQIIDLTSNAYGVIHWNIIKNDDNKDYELKMCYRPSTGSETFNVIIQNNKLTIKKNDGRYLVFSKNQAYSQTDYSVQEKILAGCWFHSAELDRGHSVLDGNGYVLCPDGSGYTFSDSKPEIKKEYFKWEFVWDTREVYFNERPIKDSFYLDINIEGRRSHHYLVEDVWRDFMQANEYGTPYNQYARFLRNYSYIAPPSNNGSITKEDGSSDPDDPQDKESDDVISSKLVGKWNLQRTGSFSYNSYIVFLNNGIGYDENYDSYSEARERYWFKWSVENGSLKRNIDGIGDETREIKFESSTLILTKGNTEVKYTYSSVYNSYPYGQPPYDGYYIHDLVTNRYYPIYSAEEKKSYASSGETYNLMYLIFKGANDGRNTWASINYATPRWDGLPAGWQEGKYYISTTTDRPYRYAAGFKIDGSTRYSTDNDYLIVKKEGNYFSYKYYGKNVAINFSGNVKN